MKKVSVDERLLVATCSIQKLRLLCGILMAVYYIIIITHYYFKRAFFMVLRMKTRNFSNSPWAETAINWLYCKLYFWT